MKYLSVLSGLLLSLHVSAQQWSWAMHLPGKYGAHMDEDASGNIYVSLGIGSNENTELRKMDAQGNILWSKTLACQVNDLETKAGEIVIAGTFTGEAAFGNFVLHSVDGYDGFIACYDANGNAQWVKLQSGLLDNTIIAVK